MNVTGVEIEKANTRTIKLDFDFRSKRQLIRQMKSRLFLFSFFRLDPLAVEAARTKRGWHIRLAAPETLRNEDISFIQLAFGSDYVRECLNWRRLKWGIKEWNILFTEKHRDGKITRETDDWPFTAQLRLALHRACNAIQKL